MSGEKKRNPRQSTKLGQDLNPNGPPRIEVGGKKKTKKRRPRKSKKHKKSKHSKKSLKKH